MNRIMTKLDIEKSDRKIDSDIKELAAAKPITKIDRDIVLDSGMAPMKQDAFQNPVKIGLNIKSEAQIRMGSERILKREKLDPGMLAVNQKLDFGLKTLPENLVMNLVTEKAPNVEMSRQKNLRKNILKSKKSIDVDKPGSLDTKEVGFE